MNHIKWGGGGTVLLYLPVKKDDYFTCNNINRASKNGQEETSLQMDESKGKHVLPRF
jgi:hypothetical protein